MPSVESVLLLTDIVGSTKITETLGDERAAEAWLAHDAAARRLMPPTAREIDRTDGFLLLFEDVASAARFALDYHEALRTITEDLGVVFRARVGIHHGCVIVLENRAEDVARGAKKWELEGLAKPTAARVMSLALGGQTLLSQTARDRLDDQELPDGALVESRGFWRMKGVTEPVELFEVGRPGEAPLVPPRDTERVYRVVREGTDWRPVEEIPHSLPRAADAFFGRDAELRTLSQWLTDGARLVTLLGPGGTGKTRLACRNGWMNLGDWPGGVWFCDLAEASTEDGLCLAVARALQLPLRESDPIAQIGEVLSGRGRLLLLLDNFEQIVSLADRSVGAWLRRTEKVSFVVTSRERLGIYGERVMVLEPLAPPAPGALDDWPGPADNPAVALFADRARAARPDFVLGSHNAADVARLVRLLDGLPLAIELAAARSRIMSPRQLVARMADRFRLLAGPSGAGHRQATMRTTLDWSWELLDSWEQAALAQASVFQGGFRLEHAEAVLDLSPWPDAPWPVDAVQALVDKSLLRVRRVDARRGLAAHEVEPRFTMYMTIHDYAAEKLREPGAIEGAGGDPQSGPEAWDAALRRHGAHFARLGTDDLAHVDQGGTAARVAELVAELDNLLVACRRAVDRSDGDVATDTYCAAAETLRMRGPYSVGTTMGARVLALPELSAVQHARAGRMLGRLLVLSGRSAEAREVLTRSHEIAQGAGEVRHAGMLLNVLGLLSRAIGDAGTALKQFNEALAIVRELRDSASEGRVLSNLGIVHMEQRRPAEARLHYEAALAIHRRGGKHQYEATARGNLGVLCLEMGLLDEASDHFAEALRLAVKLDDRRILASVRGNLGVLAMDRGRLDEAESHYRAAMVLRRELGYRHLEGMGLGNIGNLLAEQCRTEEARQHYEAALTIHKEVCNVRSEGIVLADLARLDVEQGRLGPAAVRFDAALELLGRVGDRKFEAIARRGRSVMLREDGRLDESREQLDLILAVAQEIGDRRLVASSWGLFGELALVADDLEGASEALGRAIIEVEAIGERPSHALLLGALGEQRRRSGRLAAAREAIDRGERALRATGTRRGLTTLLCRRASIDLAEGALDRAEEAFSEAAQIADEAGLASPALVRRLRALRAALSTA